ncbi:quinone oxidoreductase [Sphingobium sp. CECT 9361]|uniref:quinone oxidoreductase family protein n=1 Tax=Sphingobium sp. CECT 9361 TaxID=2845384 RepID=UPI001E5D6A60|nr:quinone oxidoreductase [Sphingobium sp. CECT 9361]CAH0348416.1 Quinone oxidoreductase 1 [Sphingobium sp. CECT 9361]
MDPWRLIVRAPGGPNAIERESFDPGAPGPDEVLLAHEAIGLNFIDIYVRTGLYPAVLPTGLGGEAAGTVIAIGDAVNTVRVGDRVTYASAAPGSYATHRILPASRLLTLPDDIPCDVAAAITLKGLTGALLVSWLADMGVTVIAHSGSPEKAARALSAGAAHSLIGDFDTLAARVRDLTAGKGVDAVFDGVGAASWSASLAALRPRGLMVSFGNASGPVPPFSVLELSKGGSLFVTRPTLFDYIREDADYRRLGQRLFDQLSRGVITSDIQQRFALADAADAHRALESRQTVGSTVLIP